MSNFNEVTLVGRIANDLEVNETSNGNKVCNFAVAVNRNNKNDDVDFFNCTAWRELAETLVSYKKKGDLILVKGVLNNDTYEKDGQKRTATKVVARNVVFLPSKNDSNSNSGSDESADFDEVPF